MNKIFNILEKSLPFVFGFCVLLFFGLVYPHHMHYHEQFQLFLTTPDFFLEIAAKPGGISDYLGMFLTQFFLFSWADFVYALTLTPTGTIVPLTIGIYKYIGTYSVQWNLIMAASVLASIPAALLLILAQRYVTAGLSVGAVKG